MHFLSATILSLLLPQIITGIGDMCTENFCNGKGYCSTNKDTNEAECNCFAGWDGASCNLNVKDLVCSQKDCGFSGIQGECVTGPTNEASCYCYSAWDGSDCSISLVAESVDYCTGVFCNDRGACVQDLKSENNYFCLCEPGYSGADCGMQLHECGHDFLLDMFTRLAMLSNDLGSSLECGFSKPIVFSASLPSHADVYTFSYCICASLLEKFGSDDYAHMLNTCNMDHYRKLEFIKEAESYCPACEELQDAIMEDLITTKSAACYHFVYQRSTMPLYWRSLWKCGCVMDIGNEATTKTIVTCPFTQHTSINDLISWDNCGGGKICDWEGMYNFFETEYSKINLDGSVACKDWMEKWIFTVPGEQRFEYMTGSFCPCMDYLKGSGPDYDAILDCIPVTFHQLSMRDLYEQLCYDPVVYNHECLNCIGYGAIKLGVVNYTAASLCYSAIEIASGLDNIDPNLNTLMCDCMVPLYDDDFDMGEVTIDAVSCVNEYFNFNVEDCPAYTDDSDDSTTTAKVKFPVQSSFSSTWFSSTSASWKTVTIIELPFSILLLVSACYLQSRKTKLNM